MLSFFFERAQRMQNICPILTLNLRSQSRKDKLLIRGNIVSGFASIAHISRLLIFFFSFRKQRFSLHLQWNLLLLGRRRKKNNIMIKSHKFRSVFPPSSSDKRRRRCRKKSMSHKPSVFWMRVVSVQRNSVQ